MWLVKITLLYLYILLLYQIDNVGNPSWQAQVSGTKLWTLVPPPECYFECAERMEATVGPGEISMSSYIEMLSPTRSFRFCLSFSLAVCLRVFNHGIM